MDNVYQTLSNEILKLDNVDNVAKTSFSACFKLIIGWNNVDNVYQTLSNEFLKLDNVDNVAKTSFLAFLSLI